MNKTQSYHFIANLTANSWRSRRTGAGVSSPSSGVRPGAKVVVYLSLPTSFVVGALCLLLGSLLLNHSAYATFSASISRSGAVSLAEPGSSTIRPTSSGTLGTGSDTVSVTTNCAYGGYKLYVSATSTGGTTLKLSDNSDSIPTSTTTTGSETTLSRDTWGVGKTASAFSGLQDYSEDIGKLTPFYAGVTSDSYTFYYGVNVSTAKTPGTYTGEVLYTVLIDEACTKYTLNFNGNNATTNKLTSQDLDFDSTINLADISSSDKIARTGYTLTGWKDQSGNSYGTTGTADVNPNDLATVTLTAEWQINSHTVTVSGGIIGTSGSTTTGTYNYGANVTIKANTPSTGYHFTSWSSNNGGSFANSTSSQTTFTVPDANVTLTARTAANTYTIVYNANGGSGTTSSQSVTYNGGNVTLRANNFSRSGYTFQGWSRSSGSSNTVHYNASAAYSINTLASNAGVTNTNGGTINLYAVWKVSSTDCSSTVHPGTTATSGCKLKDGNIWAFGNSNNSVTWNNLCTASNNCESSTYCPSGYSIPTKAMYDTLISKHGSGADLYSVLGLSGARNFWSSTEVSSNDSNAYYLRVDSSIAYGSYGGKTSSGYVLCYK